MTQEQQIRQQLAKALDWGEAHPDFHTVIDDFPIDLRGEVPPGFHALRMGIARASANRAMGHRRVHQRCAAQVSAVAARLLAADRPSPPQQEAWDQCIGSIDDLLEEMRGMILDRSRPLLEPFPRSQGQTLMREALLAADHHAYHLGEIVQVRKALKAWPK